MLHKMCWRKEGGGEKKERKTYLFLLFLEKNDQYSIFGQKEILFFREWEFFFREWNKMCCFRGIKCAVVTVPSGLLGRYLRFCYLYTVYIIYFLRNKMCCLKCADERRGGEKKKRGKLIYFWYFLKRTTNILSLVKKNSFFFEKRIKCAGVE